MFCRFCGNQINENSKFCAKCGQTIVRDENKSASTNVNEQVQQEIVETQEFVNTKVKDKKQKKNGMNKTVLVMAGMLIVYFVALSMTLNHFASLNQEQNVVEKNEEETVETQESTQTEAPVENGVAEETSLLKNLQVGDIVTFGTFEQDNNIPNGEEPIEWEVVGEKDGKYLLLSHYVLDYKSFDNGQAWDVLMANQELNESFCTWERSTVRSYLNADFYENAFSDNEKGCICLVTNTTGDWDDIHEGKLGTSGNWEKGSLGGAPTQDYVFLLSVEEVREYFAEDIWDNSYFPHDTFIPRLVASPTLYAMDKGVKVYRSEVFDPIIGGVLDENGYAHYVREDLEESSSWNQYYYGAVHPDHMKLGYFCAWGLRSPGGYTNETSVVFVKTQGNLRYDDAERGIGIRPAIWVQGN